jgi:hypothetical protein
MRHPAIVFSMLIATTSTFAASPQLAYKMGAGVYSCEEFVDLSPVLGETAFLPWAQGFMTASNMFRKASGHTTKNLNAMSTDDQQRQFVTYCRNHPKDFYLDAVLDLFTALPENPQH